MTKQYKLDAREARTSFLEYRLAPHRLWPVRVYWDGTRWVCILEHDFDANNCVIAYGNYPFQACQNFDDVWFGTVEEEEEEEF